MPHGGQHPTEEAMTITRKFLGGERAGGEQQLPSQAAPVAKRSAFGQQGARQRPGGDLITPGPTLPDPTQPLSNLPRLSDRTAPMRVLQRTGLPLSDAFLDLPGPVGFSRTPRGSAILQSILERFTREGLSARPKLLARGHSRADLI